MTDIPALIARVRELGSATIDEHSEEFVALEAAMAENERLRTELEMIRDAAADAIRDNEHVGFTVRTLHVLRSIKLKGTR